jgi:hypothetical protein
MIAIPHVTLFVVFAFIVASATIFSCFNSPTLRSGRNIGFLAAYLAGILSPFIVGLLPAAATWLVMGIIGGTIYFLWQIWTFIAEGRKAGDRFPSLVVLIHGLFLWPIMIPEALEYASAEAGILKARDVKGPDAK